MLPDDAPLVTDTRILILQHPNERRRKNLSTVPLLRLVLKHVTVKVGYEFTLDDLPTSTAAGVTTTPLLLYPGENAISLDENGSDSSLLQTIPTLDRQASREHCSFNAKNAPPPFLLIAIDGTWSEAKRMARSSPTLLEACQKVQFTRDASDDCIYDAVRREPAGHCLSTLEAVAQALARLEPPGTTAAATAQRTLRAVVQRHVDRHLINADICAARSAGKAAKKLYEKNKRRREIELELFPSTSRRSSEKQETDAVGVELRKPMETVRLQDGAMIRPLRQSDAVLVESWWEHRTSKSLAMVSRQIELDGGVACLGVEVEGALVACIMRYQGGALGMLHCHSAFRRRGYASALLQHATRALELRGEECIASIVDGNTASEALFVAAGWERENPAVKKGTGRRKARRKWIKRQRCD